MRADPTAVMSAAPTSAGHVWTQVVAGYLFQTEVKQMPTWAWVLIIVLIAVALFGGFGYSRR